MAYRGTRRDFLRGFGLGAAALLPGLGKAASAQPTVHRPNILFILVDDLGSHQLGCYGNSYYYSPNIDRLASEGMKFTDAYACPVCSPTRAAIMTGKYPARLHLTDYIPGDNLQDRKLLTPPWTEYLPLSEVTIPEALKPAGYYSGHFGKWHLNKDKNYMPGRPGDPASQGFDVVLTTHKPKPDADPSKDAHHVKLVTDHAIAFIEENKGRRFFCYVPHDTIHRPVMEAPELVAKYKAKPGASDPKNDPVVAAMVETLDKHTGRLLDALDRNNLRDNTVVIFYSDNGALGNHNVLKPLRGAKASLYEGGIRVPLMVRWPGVVKPGSVCHSLVDHIDFFPTLTEIAGIDAMNPAITRGTDGETLMPLLRQTGELERDTLYWHFPHYHHQGIGPCGAIRQGDYKLIEWFEKSIDGIDTPGALELFDLKNDLSEQHNLADKMPDKKMQLYRRLSDWRGTVAAELMIRNPKWQPKRS